MFGFTPKRLAVLLVVVIVCAGTTVAWSQQPMYVPADSGYSATPAGPSDAPRLAERPTYATASSYNDDDGLGDRVAALEAALEKSKAKAAGKPSVKVGGRIFADWTTYDQNPGSVAQIGSDQQNGFRFDATRIFVAGSAFHVVDYKVQFDFAGTQTAGASTLQAPTYKDVYIAVKELPLLGHVKVGHYKEPFGLEQLTSARFITFMERGLSDVFVPARNVGVSAYDYSDSENLTWAIGVFTSEIGDEPPIFRDDSGGTAVTMRTTYLPWYDEATEGRGLLHTGIAYSYRDIADDSITFAKKPEADLGSDLLSVTIPNVPDYQLLGLEAALVYGSFSLQTEYIHAFIDRTGAADVDLDGAYVYMSYFLTGENRVYNRHCGAFNRIKPFENFFRVRTEDCDVQTGKGAWELAYRFSYLDLDDVGVAGGNAGNHTFGVNWYLNPYTRMMLNYINSTARVAGVEGDMDILEVRAQVDF